MTETRLERIARLEDDAEENLDESVWVTPEGETVEAADRDIWLDVQWLIAELVAAEERAEAIEKGRSIAYNALRDACVQRDAAEERANEAERAAEYLAERLGRYES